ncbi:MAG: DEAD/DEAH box helicase, partial [Lentisphaeraceae bacterium]|nr:DEAD/DEAH box helicase [Lentisphaeraceae bacterium]
GAGRVYYLAPTTVILNQVADEIEQYHSGSTLLFHYLEKSLTGNDEYSENPDDRERKMHALDAGLVVTTYHRMIQLLSGQDKKSCALLRGAKEATFVLDECQSLTYFQFTILANLFTVMAEFSKIRVIFMSATPQTEAVFMNALKTLKSSRAITLESLLPSSISQTIHESPFVNERRSIRVLDNHDSIEKLAQEVLEYRETQVDKSLLVLVNLAGDALKLAELLEPDYCITSNLRPIDLKAQLKRASEEMKSDPIFMIATSIIQAGVDLDFDAGFIELQELRNFRQGCGRVGRNYHELRGTCPVFSFELITQTGKHKGQSSWFKQRFYDDTKSEDDAVKLEINIINDSLAAVKASKSLLYDADIEKIEQSFEPQVFKIQESLSEKLIVGMSESYKKWLDDNYAEGQGANFSEVIWYLTEPLKSDEGEEFIVLFTDQEQDTGLKLIGLMDNYQDSCKELHRLKDKSQFFSKLKLIKKQRSDIRAFMAPYALRKWNILNSLKRNAQSLRSHNYEEFCCRILLNMTAEVYQADGYGWQSKVDEGIEAASISI